MKKFLLLLLLSSSLSVFSQWSGRLEYVNFRGFHNQVFKPTVGAVLQFSKSDKYDNFRMGVTLGFRYYNTREDSYPYLRWGSLDGTSKVFPDKTVIDKFYSLPISIFGEYKFGEDQKIYPLIGGSVIAEFNQLNYHSDNNHVTGASYGFALSTYLGASYMLNDSFELVPRITYEHTIKEGTLARYSKWLFSIGIIYYNY